MVDEVKDSPVAEVGAGTITPASPSHDARLSSLKVFWINAGVLLVLLFALLPLINSHYIALPDEGVYSAQAQNLANGSWAGPRPAPDIDRSGRLDSIGPSATFTTTDIPYAKHPLYPIVLLAGYSVFGIPGLLAVSVVGLWAAAVTAGLLTRHLKADLALPALWLTAVGSPLLFSAYVVMAHSLAAALTGAMVLALTVALDRRRWLLVLPGLLAAAALVAIRSEGAIVVAATGAVIGLMALPIPGRRRIDLPAAGTGAAVLAAGAAAFLLDMWASARILSLNSLGSNPVQTVQQQAGPWEAARISLVQPWYSAIQASSELLILLLAVVLGAVVLRFLTNLNQVALGLWGLAALAGAVFAFRNTDLVTGLLPTFPLLIFPLLFTRREDLMNPLYRRLCGISLISGVGIVLTMYSDGGAAQWGGRFFHLLIPLLVPLVVIGVLNAVSRLPTASQMRFAASCLAVVALSLSVVALRANRSFRELTRSTVAATMEHVDAWSGGRQLVVVGRNTGDGTSRQFWNVRDEVDVLTSGGLPLLVPLVHEISRTDIDRVLIVSDVDKGMLRYVDKKGLLGRGGWTITDDTVLGRSGLHLLDLRRRGQ